MITLLFSDPHLGLARKAGTTPQSSLKWRDAIYQQAMQVCSMRADKLMCLGDLFDRFSNQEELVLQGIKVLERVTCCLAGNHDVTAQKDVIGSLQLLRDAVYDDKRVLLNRYGESNIWHSGDGDYTMIPHCASQDLFDEALLKAESVGVGGDLLLHCNYNFSYAATPTTLNLTRNRAKELLDVYRHIIIGHEHTYRTDLDDRVIIPGSPFPTAFDNMGDKYVMEKKDDGEYEVHLVWERFEGFRKGSYDLLKVGGPAQFLHVAGECSPTQAKHLWEAYPNLLAVKIEGVQHVPEAVDEPSQQGLKSLVDVMDDAIKRKSEPAVTTLWNRARRELDL